jgi:hypothetical protein
MSHEPQPTLAPSGDDQWFDRPITIVVVAVAAALVKVAIASFTLGSNDVIAFYQFAKALEAHGLPWTYEHSILFNHPPLVGYLLEGLVWLDHQPFFQENGLTFPLLLRLPGIAADFGVVLLLLPVIREYRHLRPPKWALLLFAASPVSIMVAGFHGNTDSIMVLFLVLGSIMVVRDRPLLCGVFLALSCQIKIIPLLLLPIFFFFWMARSKARWFVAAFLSTVLLLAAEPLLRSPAAFAKNVLSYGSFWGVWGLTYCLRMTGLQEFSKTSFFNLTPAQNIIMTGLKLLVLAGILLLAWRRRKLAPSDVFASIGHAWMIFFVFSPAVAAQYLVWLAPFILLLWPAFYGILVVASSAFLFALYTITSGGFPWYFAHASNKLNSVCAQWAVIPWLTLVAGLVGMMWRARRQTPDLRMMSVEPIDPSKRD